MSDTSLHTKYRPKKLSDMIGQEHVLASVESVLKNKRAKTFLLCGPAGTGKTTLARIMAGKLAGKARTAANIEEVPAAQSNGVDAVRAIVAKTMTRAIGPSSVKCFILDEAHRITGAAWDILLKPTEEPPEHVFWFFCTTEPGKIPAPIKTRAVTFNLKPVKEEDIFELVKGVAEAEGMELDDEVLEAIAEDAAGSPRQALVYLEMCAYCENAQEVRTTTRSAAGSAEVADLCRLLGSDRPTWTQATTILKILKETVDGESVRIVVSNWFAAVALNAKSTKAAIRALETLSYFEEPYMSSDKYAPLLLSVARALKVGESER